MKETTILAQNIILYLFRKLWKTVSDDDFLDDCCRIEKSIDEVELYKHFIPDEVYNAFSDFIEQNLSPILYDSKNFFRGHGIDFEDTDDSDYQSMVYLEFIVDYSYEMKKELALLAKDKLKQYFV